MTSDYVQNSFTSRDKAALVEKAFIAGSFDARRVPIANVNLNETKKKKTTGDVDKTALLKTAYKMLRQAEKNLADKEERIRTLEELVTVDELTGLVNRRGFFRNFGRELARTDRAENQGGLLIMIDLDYFKAINDRYGHLAGDEALREVGSFLRNNIRPMDIAARLGGDEFIILMPGTNISQAMKRARKLGNALNDLSFNWKEEAVRIHASIGLKEFVPGDTIESVIEEADNGLYQDKEQRKSRYLEAAE